ncbi:Uncharacterised protein [Mycolicibacterium flavescens]|uniref:hypothetical protein n=1 Tax=Mycobacterium neumannii TaxID=2048551 RepID=UPI000B93D340|nr:hypothetical protein [Mycobacterium neumannii]VEG38942.1 Uncharacterised protein [Mycolicibacterium flavescens]
MTATAPTATTRPDETVRLRPGDLPVRPRPVPVSRPEVKTTRLRPVAAPTKPLPKAVSAFDGKTVRLRALELPVVAKVTSTVRQRYVDLNKVKKPPTKWDIARLSLVMLLASMPILGISVDVFGLVPQNVTSVVVIALCAVLGALIAFAPHRMDIFVGRGLIAGMVACIVYDAARLFAVHVLGLMGDFIPVMGSFVTGEPDTAGSAAVGYVWRYIGDGGGLGVAFFVVAFTLGIDRWKNVYAVLASVAFAVFPTWAGLMATVALAPRGEEMMFPLNVATVTITLVGHLIFGLVLGLAFLKAPRGREHSEWPWPPLFESAQAKRVIRAYKKFTNRP